MRDFMGVFVFRVATTFSSLGLSLWCFFQALNDSCYIMVVLVTVSDKNEVGLMKLRSFFELTNEKDHHYF